MKSEIGSEYWTGCTPLDGTGVEPLMPKGFNSKYTLCGRTGLEIIVSDILACAHRSLKVYMPSYCCHTMIEPFDSHGVEVKFYEVTRDEKRIVKHIDDDNDCDIVFLLDYFGFIDPRTEDICKRMRAKGKIVIYDATLSFFCKDMQYENYDYVFGSFRKWIGVNAGFCSKNGGWQHLPSLEQNKNYTELRNRCFDMKADFMEGDQVDKNIFLTGFGDAEEGLETIYRNFAPDTSSIEIIKHVNVEFLREQRRDNAKALISAFGVKKGGVDSMFAILSGRDCPLFVPLDVDMAQRSMLRSWLIKNNCYLPIHWPVSALHRLNDRTTYLYNTELSCICDQRYDEEDISKLIERIKQFS